MSSYINCRDFAVIFAIFTKVCRVFCHFCRDFLLSLARSDKKFYSYSRRGTERVIPRCFPWLFASRERIIGTRECMEWTCGVV